MTRFITLTVIAAIVTVGVASYGAGAGSATPEENIADANREITRIEEEGYEVREVLADYDARIAALEAERQIHQDDLDSLKTEWAKYDALRKAWKSVLDAQQMKAEAKTVESAVVKHGASPEVQSLVDYAWEVSGGDKDFILTIDAENSQWSPDRRSDLSYWRNGKEYWDTGICQISEYYHPEIVYSERFSDPYWQIDQCWRLYSGGTRFYGYDVRMRKAPSFQFPV
jgi:hypothetical protein